MKSHIILKLYFKQATVHTQCAHVLRSADAHEHVWFAVYCHVKHFRLLDDNNAVHITSVDSVQRRETRNDAVQHDCVKSVLSSP